MADIPAWLYRWRVTRDWQGHLNHGSIGGVDWAAPAGTAILAPSDGRLSFYTYRDGSSCLRVRRADGTSTEFLHGVLIGSSGRDVAAGERIGTSDGRKGQPGAGPSTGAHIHVHDINARGGRVYPFSTIAGGSTAPAGEIEDDDMALTPEQDARLKLIEAAIVSFPGGGQVISRLQVPGAGYDYLPAIVNQGHAIMQMLQALAVAAPDVDEKALAAEIAKLVPPVDTAALAAQLGPMIVSVLSGELEGVVTGADLEGLKADILGAIALVDENTLATFGLQRRAS